MTIRDSTAAPAAGARLAMPAVCLLGAGLLLGFIGACNSKSEKGPRRGPAAQTNVQGSLFDSVAETLDHLEQFEASQILKQVCDRLNQWYLQEKPRVAWQPDPLLAGLSDELRNLPAVKLQDTMQFRQTDGWFLQESIWLRDISKTAREDQFDDLAVAERLFDWTVRNVQLEKNADSQARANPHRPYETLLLGRGTALDRAWVFMLLARQQGLDTVMLALGDPASHDARPWLRALFAGGELHLFDCRLGLPIPGPQGQGIATLSQVVADEQLLRGLDLDADHAYPVGAEDLRHVIGYIEGSPVNLSHRMALVESRLVGKHKTVLTSPGSKLAERLRQVPQLADVQLWPWPFVIWRRQSKLGEEGRQAALQELFVFQAIPQLMAARALYFKGAYDGETGAKKNYLDSRLPDTYIDQYKLPAKIAKQIRPENLSKVEASQIVMLRQAKQCASLWLGLIFFEQRDYPDAIDYFGKRALDKRAQELPNSVWTVGARYNLARTYEASGDAPRAIAAYEADKTSPQSHGNQLRARRLKQQTAPAAAQ